MKEYTVTVDVPVIEGQIFAPSQIQWGQLAYVKGFKILGVATHDACVSISLILVTDDDFNPQTADWVGITRRPDTRLQLAISVREYTPGPQTVAPRGGDTAAFGKIGG
jgi:hypothetical protein